MTILNLETAKINLENVCFVAEAGTDTETTRVKIVTRSGETEYVDLPKGKRLADFRIDLLPD
jgi:hypothetical protein